MTVRTPLFESTGVERNVRLSSRDLRPEAFQPDQETVWDRAIAEVEGFRSLREDWDGAGALPPHRESIARVLRMLATMQDTNGAIPPSAVSPGVNGDILLVWEEQGYYVEIEVGPSGPARWMRQVGSLTEHGEARDWLNCHVAYEPIR